jgi:hypothetical protein
LRGRLNVHALKRVYSTHGVAEIKNGVLQSGLPDAMLQFGQYIQHD